LRTEELQRPKPLSDISGMHKHAWSIQNDAKMTANSPTGTKIWCRGEADGLENVSDAPIIRRDVHIDENNTKRAENVSKNIKHVK